MSTSTSLVTGVDFITVPTKDFDEAFEFYGEVLGWSSRSAGETCPAPSSRPAP